MTPFIPLAVQAEEDEKQERIPARSAAVPLLFLFRSSYYSPPLSTLLECVGAPLS